MLLKDVRIPYAKRTLLTAVQKLKIGKKGKSRDRSAYSGSEAPVEVRIPSVENKAFGEGPNPPSGGHLTTRCKIKLIRRRSSRKTSTNLDDIHDEYSDHIS